jgi:predicted Na+-dependent transporter
MVENNIDLYGNAMLLYCNTSLVLIYVLFLYFFIGYCIGWMYKRHFSLGLQDQILFYFISQHQWMK